MTDRVALLLTIAVAGCASTASAAAGEPTFAQLLRQPGGLEASFGLAFPECANATKTSDKAMQCTITKSIWRVLNDTVVTEAERKEDLKLMRDAMDSVWIQRSTIIIFMMQLGFALLEAGCVRKMNVVSICAKNLSDFGIGALGFWLFGFGFAYGGDEPNAADPGTPFVGAGGFGSGLARGNGVYAKFMFQPVKILQSPASVSH